MFLNIRKLGEEFTHLSTKCRISKIKCWAKKLFFLIKKVENNIFKPELGTFEWWISGLMLDPLFFLISRVNKACSPLDVNLQIN